MAFTLVQSNKGTSATATTSPAFLSASTTGNLVVLSFNADDYNGTPDSGWTQSTGMEQQTFCGAYIWWRISAGETSFSYTIGSATNSAWVLEEWSGNSASPYDISNGTFTQSTGNTQATPTIIPTTGDRLLVAAVGGSKTGALTGGPSTFSNSFTADKNAASAGSGTNDCVGVAYRLLTGDGATGYTTTGTLPDSDQSRTGLIIAFKVAAGGSDLTVNVSDSVSTTNVPALQCPSPVNVSDSTSVSETVRPLLIGNINVSDAVATSETVAAQCPSPLSVSDSAHATETVNLNLPAIGTLTVNVSDATSVSETVAARCPSPISVADATSVSEIASATMADLKVAVTDLTSAIESTTVVLPTAGSLTITVQDSAHVSETTNCTVSTSRIAVSDSTSITEFRSVFINAPGQPPNTHPPLGGTFDTNTSGGTFNGGASGGSITSTSRGGNVTFTRPGGTPNTGSSGGTIKKPTRGGIVQLPAAGGDIE